MDEYVRYMATINCDTSRMADLIPVLKLLLKVSSECAFTPISCFVASSDGVLDQLKSLSSGAKVESFKIINDKRMCLYYRSEHSLKDFWSLITGDCEFVYQVRESVRS